MSYTLHITRAAEQDIGDAADYIEVVLKNPDAADRLLDAVTEIVSALAISPEIYPVVDDPVLRSWGIRFITVKNYLAFYTIDDENRTIYIVRFLYNKRDWHTILGQGIDFS